MRLLTSVQEGTSFSASSEIADHVRIRVSDTGIGIEPEAVPILFDRFSHGPTQPAGSRRYGIGLSLVREIAHSAPRESLRRIDTGCRLVLRDCAAGSSMTPSTFEQDPQNSPRIPAYVDRHGPDHDRRTTCPPTPRSLRCRVGFRSLRFWFSAPFYGRVPGADSGSSHRPSPSSR